MSFRPNAVKEEGTPPQIREFVTIHSGEVALKGVLPVNPDFPG